MRNRGQSAVIGVVLVVALVVVLGTTVAAYSFGVVDRSSNSYSPADSNLKQTLPASQGEDSAKVVLTFTQVGETIPSDQIKILADGQPVENSSKLNRTNSAGNNSLGAGDSITIHQTDRTGLHGGTKIQVVRVRSDQTTLLHTKTLDGRNVSIGSFGFSYYTLANFDGGKICTYYSGSSIDPSRISIEVYNGANWVSPQQFYNSNFDISNLISSGQNKINTPGDNLGDDDLRVVYQSINGETVLYKEENINYSPC